MNLRIKYLRIILKLKRLKLIQKLIDFIKNSYHKALDTNSNLRIQIFQFLPFFVASTLSGIAAYIYYLIFNFVEKASLHIYEKNNVLIFVLTPVFFLISWWLVKRYSTYAKGSGIPQVMAAIELSKPETRHLIQKLLSTRIILIKVLSSIAKVMGGGITGREGPTIQISGSIFSTIYKIIPSWWPHISRKNIMVAGAASGLAAAFNTPLGGIVFAMEELSKYQFKYYKSPLFIAVIIAGLAAQGLGGSYLYLGYPKLNIEGYQIYLGVIIVGIIAGYSASKMSSLMLILIKFINQLKSDARQILIVLISALVVSSFIYIFGHDAFGSGKELMEKLLFTNDKHLEWYIPFVRIISMVSTFSFGGAGGIFAPSLSAGASIGAVISEIMNLSLNNSNLLILAGMTAFLTGVTRAPFTSAIIVFEMTDRHSVIFFLMLSAILANIISNRVDKKSFYDHIKENYIEDLKNNFPEEKSLKIDK
ncbi:MAG: chloride channel protein [Deltaproteobacteria bacterium]